MKQFMQFVQNSHARVTVTKDKNLEIDPYFYERRAKLHQIRADIKRGQTEMLSEEQYKKEMATFFAQTYKQMKDGSMKMYSESEATQEIDRFLKTLQ